jgi:2-oxoglutarate/2-oxoacid ferredoxin oxidoreductase subunit alpha
LKWDESYKPDRGRVLSKEDLEKIEKFYRYSPADDLEVAARTVPGVSSKGAFFTRGSGHNRLGGYTEIPDEYQDVIDRLLRKHKASAAHVPEPIIETHFGATFGLVTIGGCDSAAREAMERLRANGHIGDYMRIRGFPFPNSVEEFLQKHDMNFIVEQNRDAQLKTLLTIETGVPKEKLSSILVYGGFPLSARTVVEKVQAAREDRVFSSSGKEALG